VAQGRGRVRDDRAGDRHAEERHPGRKVGLSAVMAGLVRAINVLLY
jgi:hypothetical protein